MVFTLPILVISWKKTDYDTKIGETEKKYLIMIMVNISEVFNKLAAANFAARLAQSNLATKIDIADFAKETNFDDKLKNIKKKVTLRESNIYWLKMN